MVASVELPDACRGTIGSGADGPQGHCRASTSSKGYRFHPLLDTPSVGLENIQSACTGHHFKSEIAKHALLVDVWQGVGNKMVSLTTPNPEQLYLVTLGSNVLYDNESTSLTHASGSEQPGCLQSWVKNTLIHF